SATLVQKPLLSLLHTVTIKYMHSYLYFINMFYFIFKSFSSRTQLIPLLDSFKTARFQSKTSARMIFFLVIVCHQMIHFCTMFQFICIISLKQNISWHRALLIYVFTYTVNINLNIPYILIQ